MASIEHSPPNDIIMGADEYTVSYESFVNKKDYINIQSGGRLPHWHQEGKMQFITFRLADSLPQEKLVELKQMKEEWLLQHPLPWDERTTSDYNDDVLQAIDYWLDAGMGSCILARNGIRQIVVDTLMKYHNDKYVLHAFVVMPNHVHLLLTPLKDYKTVDLIGRVKGHTAYLINKSLGRQGKFWQTEMFDRMVRSHEDFISKISYIKNNPVNLASETFTIGGEALTE